MTDFALSQAPGGPIVTERRRRPVGGERAGDANAICDHSDELRGTL